MPRVANSAFVLMLNYCPPDGIHFMHAPVSGQAHGSASLLIQQNHLLGRRLRVVCISHFTSDFLPPCMQKPKNTLAKMPGAQMHLAHPPRAWLPLSKERASTSETSSVLLTRSCVSDIKTCFLSSAGVCKCLVRFRIRCTHVSAARWVILSVLERAHFPLQAL